MCVYCLHNDPPKDATNYASTQDFISSILHLKYKNEIDIIIGQLCRYNRTNRICLNHFFTIFE